jgi:hypothetical protein
MEWFKLSYRSIVILFVIYCGFILIGLALSIVVVLHEYSFVNPYPILMKAVLGSFGISLVGSSLFYSRKLYKASIGQQVSQPQPSDDSLRQLGVFMYFLLRPIFALCFAFLIILFFKVSLLIVAVKDQTFSDGFIYLSMFMSFFAGFSSGDILQVLEEIGRTRMERFFHGTD